MQQRMQDEEIRKNRERINVRLDEMGKAGTPSLAHTFFKSTWFIAIAASVVLVFLTAGDKGTLPDGSINPVRIVAYCCLAYGLLADLVFAPLAKKSYEKKRTAQKQVEKELRKQERKQQRAGGAEAEPRKSNKRLTKSERAKLGTAAQNK